MSKRIRIFDTTLRDGEQMPGVNFGICDKLNIALALEAAGVDIVEAGFPAASADEYTAVTRISENINEAGVAALARADIKDIDIALEALSKAKKPLLHIFIAASDIHLQHKLHLTRSELLERIREVVTYAAKRASDIEFSAEDASRTDRDFLLSVYRTAVECGAKTVNIPDTVGYATPDEFGGLVGFICTGLPGVPVSVHCHNDLGLAAANTLAALKAGAVQCDCTVNGIGERAGNAPLEEIVMALKTRFDEFGLETGIRTECFSKLSATVASLAGYYIAPNKPIVGKNAFAHESGIHQHGVLSDRRTYEIMEPGSVGIKQSSIILGKLSGSHAFEEKLKELDIHYGSDITKAAFRAFKDLACRKTDVTDDDIRALVDEAAFDARIVNGYELESYQTQSGDHCKAMALITLSREGKSFTEAAAGEGPIDACFNALNRIVGRDFRLINYGIKSVTGGTDALGEVRVKISDSVNEYSGKGVSTDIIKSSIKAYINAVNRAMFID